MGLSGIKPINSLSDSNFYQKIMQKYHNGKKYTSRFPTMFFYKGKRSVFPNKITMILKFNFHLNQQKSLPLLILKTNQALKGTLLGLKTEKKKLSLTVLKIPQGFCVASEQLLAGNISTNKITVLSFLKSLICRSENKTNNLNKILKLSFLSVNNALNYQKASTIFQDILTLNTKISNKEDRQKYWPIFEYKQPSNYFEKQNISSLITVKNSPVIKEIFSWLNTEQNGLQSIMNQKGSLATNDITNACVSQAAFKISQEFHTRSDFFLTGNTSTNKMLKSLFLPVNNTLDYQKTNTIYPGFLALNPKFDLVRELLINSEKTSMFTVFKKYIERFLPFRFSTIHTHDSKLLNYEINMEILNSQIFRKNIYSKLLSFEKSPAFNYNINKLKYWLIFEDKSLWNYLGKQNIIPFSIGKNIHVIKEISPRLNTGKKDLQSLLKLKNVQNKSDIANVYGSSAAFKIPSMYQNASRFLPIGRIFANKNLVFSFKGHVSELLISSEKVNIIAVFNKYIERFYPFRFSISHAHDPFLKSSIFKARDKVTNSNKILKLLTLSENSIYYQYATSSTYFGAKEVSYQMLNHKINENVLKSQIFRLNENCGLFKNYELLLSNSNSDFISKNSLSKDHLTSEKKVSAVLVQDNLLFDKINSVSRPFFKEQNWVTANKPFAKNFYENFEQEIPSYIQSKNASEISNENLIFRDQRQIEQEIELIKKTILETKKSVSEKTVPVFGEAEIKKYLDINRISSQVYQNIERTIRMERERRGM